MKSFPKKTISFEDQAQVKIPCFLFRADMYIHAINSEGKVLDAKYLIEYVQFSADIPVGIRLRVSPISEILDAKLDSKILWVLSVQTRPERFIGAVVHTLFVSISA